MSTARLFWDHIGIDMLPSWFDLIDMSKKPAHQGKEYEGRTLQGAELHLLVDRLGRRCYRIYAMKKDARLAAGWIHNSTMRPCAIESQQALQKCHNSDDLASEPKFRTQVLSPGSIQTRFHVAVMVWPDKHEHKAGLPRQGIWGQNDVRSRATLTRWSCRTTLLPNIRHEERRPSCSGLNS